MMGDSQLNPNLAESISLSLETGVVLTSWVTERKGQPWCEYCKRPGHVRGRYWKLHGKLAEKESAEKKKTPKQKMEEIHRGNLSQQRRNQLQLFLSKAPYLVLNKSSSFKKYFLPIWLSIMLPQLTKELDSGKTIGNASVDSGLYLLQADNSSLNRQTHHAECFDPIVAKSGRDLIPVMVYGRNISGQEFGGMYCVVLTVNSVVVSAGLLRIFGHEVAELPLVATSREHQGQGYFQVLFSCIETLLSSLNVENLVLPAAEEAESIWTKKFGFRKMTEGQLLRYQRELQLTIFKGTSMLEKKVQQIPEQPE